jgi:hypothetical protein
MGDLILFPNIRLSSKSGEIDLRDDTPLSRVPGELVILPRIKVRQVCNLFGFVWDASDSPGPNADHVPPFVAPTSPTNAA